jgi:hypothetical protein
MNSSLSTKKMAFNNSLNVDEYIQKQQGTSSSIMNVANFPEESSSSPFDEEYSIYFYSDPISVPPSVVEGTACTISNMVEICAVITFNLGIALYRLSSQVDESGRINTAKKTKTLRKSLAFFDKSRVICQSRGVSTNSTSVPLFSMVVLNNMGVLLRLLGHKESSQQLFEELIVLCWLHLCSSNVGPPHPKQQQSLKSCILMLDGFLLNALQGQSTVAGAA